MQKVKKTNQKLLFEEWKNKADEDELSAGGILRHKEGVPSTVCFLSQQMAEKYLKGFLLFKEVQFPKIHDLIKLKKMILEFEPEIKDIEDELVILNRYYIETRYPGDFPDLFWPDAEEAFEAAEKIKEFILDKVN